jgi:hypothetical protein
MPSHVPPIEWLQEAQAGRLEVTGENVWKAFRYRAYIQVLDEKEHVFETVPSLKLVKGFRVTQRGKELIETAKNPSLKAELKGADDPPTKLWLSAFKRWVRNVPKGMKLAQSDGELHVLAPDAEGKIKNDEAHRLFSLKVPWVE